MAVHKKEVELVQKQLENKERENEELRRQRVNDNKEVQTLRKELGELKSRL